MTLPEASGTPPEMPPRPHAGLRARLWIGALAGAVVGAAGIAWAFSSTATIPDPLLRAALMSKLSGVAIAALLTGAACAWWLDRGIVERLRRLTYEVRSPQTLLPDRLLPSGWGELAELRAQIGALITRHRHATRAAEQLE